MGLVMCDPEDDPDDAIAQQTADRQYVENPEQLLLYGIDSASPLAYLIEHYQKAEEWQKKGDRLSFYGRLAGIRALHFTQVQLAADQDAGTATKGKFADACREMGITERRAYRAAKLYPHIQAIVEWAEHAATTGGDKFKYPTTNAMLARFCPPERKPAPPPPEPDTEPPPPEAPPDTAPAQRNRSLDEYQRDDDAAQQLIMELRRRLDEHTEKLEALQAEHDHLLDVVRSAARSEYLLGAIALDVPLCDHHSEYRQRIGTEYTYDPDSTWDELLDACERRYGLPPSAGRKNKDARAARAGFYLLLERAFEDISEELAATRSNSMQWWRTMAGMTVRQVLDHIKNPHAKLDA